VFAHCLERAHDILIRDFASSLAGMERYVVEGNQHRFGIRLTFQPPCPESTAIILARTFLKSRYARGRIPGQDKSLENDKV
jgi:hypothetical protein